MSETASPIPLQIHAMSSSDDLGFLGQQAVASAATPGAEYLIVGGNMVRLLGEVYPTALATPRSTIDADAAVEDLEVIGSIAERLMAGDFAQEGGNLFVKSVGLDRIEVNLLLSRHTPKPGKGTLDVPGVGQVDVFPELVFAMAQPALALEMMVTLTSQEVISYTTRIPSLEAAVILKAHAWRGRLAQKDLLDLNSLLEIRDAHPETGWRLNSRPLSATRRDAAQILHTLRGTTLAHRVTRPGAGLPAGLDRLRMAALISRHIATV